MIERGPPRPTKVLSPAERYEEPSRVVLLSETTNTSTVAEAILVGNGFNKKELSKLVKETAEFSERFESFNLEDDAMNGEFVYDVYRLDLGRFTSKDIEGKVGIVQIVPYEQEFLSDEEGSESETFEDDNDSNAEDYYANDYPDEESCTSDNDGELEFDFNESIEIEDIDEDDDDNIDLDSDDYADPNYYDSFTDSCDDDYDEDCLNEMECSVYNFGDEDSNDDDC